MRERAGGGGGREEWETNDRRRRTEMDGRIEKNHLATGHYNNTWFVYLGTVAAGLITILPPWIAMGDPTSREREGEGGTIEHSVGSLDPRSSFPVF